MKQLILHIPHSSDNIPFYDGYCVSEQAIKSEMLKLTDWHTEDLFFSPNAKIIKAEFSRIFCDVERFEDDSQEIMALFGMGAIYNLCDDGSILRNVTIEIRKKIIEEYYQEHHRKLLTAVSSNLEKFDEALIIDCHSFSDIPFFRDLNQNLNRPDICIGTDEYHTPKNLVEFAKEYFENLNLKVLINNPYSGTIVPMEYFQKDKRVKSIMIEINRKLYLKAGTNEKSENYSKIKEIICNFIKDIA